MNENTTPWNRLQALLDAMFGFTNRTRSTVKVMQQGFDNKTQEHVIWIEYRAQVKPGITPKPQPQRAPMASIREMFSRRRQGLA